MGKQHCVFICMQVIVCFVFPCKTHALTGFFSKNHITGGKILSPCSHSWIADLPPWAKTSVNNSAPRRIQTALQLCSNLPSSPFSPTKRKKNIGQCPKPEVEFLPLPSPCFFASFPQKSHWLQLTTFSSEHVQTQCLGEEG